MALNVGLRLRDPSFIGTADDLGGDEGDQQPQDEHHDHDLDQRETGLHGQTTHVGFLLDQWNR